MLTGPSTWRYLDIVVTIYNQNNKVNLNSTVFEYFEFDGAPINTVLGEESYSTYILKPPENDIDGHTCLLKLEKYGDQYRSKATLWASKLGNCSEEELKMHMDSNRFQYLWRWDGFAGFRIPSERKITKNGLFSNYDMVAILREYRMNLPGVLFIENRQFDENIMEQKYVLRTPYGMKQFYIRPIALGSAS